MLARRTNRLDLLIDQIEFADVIVLNKLDLVTEEQAGEVEAIINALPEIIATTRSKVPLDPGSGHQVV